MRKKVLIIAGPNSGRAAHIIYTYFRHVEDGYCQEEPHSMCTWEEIFWVVPIYDHCGEPKLVELKENEFVELK